MYTFALAGSTPHSVLCAQTLLDNGNFELAYILTPQARPVGRKQVLTPSFVANWAQQNHSQVPIITLNKKIDESAKNNISDQKSIDFLLVVDFGFFVPNWLLQLPKISSLNIHPSALPKYRGASPGQYVLLFGEKESAITLMIPNSQMDQGDIIAQIPFQVNPDWNQATYYDFAFNLICDSQQGNLAGLISDFAEGKITPQPQPLSSPTQSANLLTKKEVFVSWSFVRTALHQASDHTVLPNENLTPSPHLETKELWHKNSLLNQINTDSNYDFSPAQLLNQAIHAFNPWPLVWTFFPHNDGSWRRLQLLNSHLSTANQHLMLDEIRFEGKPSQQLTNHD